MKYIVIIRCGYLGDNTLYTLSLTDGKYPHGDNIESSQNNGNSVS
jgi:hypothetical protein